MNRRWLIFDNVCVIMTGMSVHEILSSSKERPRGQFDYVDDEGDVRYGCDDENVDVLADNELMELQDYKLRLVAVRGLSAHGQQEHIETNTDNDDNARRQAEFDIEREFDKNPRLSASPAIRSAMESNSCRTATPPCSPRPSASAALINSST